MAGFVVLENVVKRYQMGEITITAVDGVSFFHRKKGSFASCWAKAAQARPRCSIYWAAWIPATKDPFWWTAWTWPSSPPRQLTGYRRNDIGFVFQFYNLMQNLTAKENVELAAQICRHPLDAATVLTQVGLADRMDNFPAQLSGGEQQRVAIARALAKNPKLLLCDEPTGALDDQTGRSILALLQQTCRSQGMTVIVITHNQAIAPMADQVIHMRSGRVTQIVRNEHPTPVEQIEW